eukprot:gene7536-10050_t
MGRGIESFDPACRANFAGLRISLEKSSDVFRFTFLSYGHRSRTRG